MIQANELRIGNWVIYCHPKGWYLYQIKAEDIALCSNGERTFQPIAITSGLLEKCGFVRVGESQEYMFNNFSLVDYSDDNNLFGWFDNGKVRMIPHLHTLQNGYHFLTNGQELTINL